MQNSRCLKVEQASWDDAISPTCDLCNAYYDVPDEQHVLSGKNMLPCSLALPCTIFALAKLPFLAEAAETTSKALFVSYILSLGHAHMYALLELHIHLLPNTPQVHASNPFTRLSGCGAVWREESMELYMNSNAKTVLDFKLFFLVSSLSLLAIKPSNLTTG
eukprot:1152063-Pelagomonas_calceolata.AAC.1